jgi:hypothetical protein
MKSKKYEFHIFNQISDTTRTVKYRTIRLNVDGFICTESYIDGVLTSQNWSVKGGFRKTHKSAYEAKNLSFKYYDDISFLKTDDVINRCDGFACPEPTLIDDWELFKGLDHVVCDWTSMDGNVYNIGTPTPITLWRWADYISVSITDKDYDLCVIADEIKSKAWVKNVEIVDIPFYNQFDGSRKALEFEYKLPSKKSIDSKLKDIKDIARKQK